MNSVKQMLNGQMASSRVKMASNGRLVVPASIRKAVGLQRGGTVVIENLDGELRIRPFDEIVAEAQSLVEKYVPQDVALSDELIVDRRKEARSEGANAGSE